MAHDFDAEFGKLLDRAPPLRLLAPQTAAILDHDHVELTAPRSGKQCLIAGPVGRAAGDRSVSKEILDQPTLHLNTLLCERARWTAEPMEYSALLAAPARLAKRLLSLATLHGRETPGGTQLAISQEELAQFRGLSRQTVNQHLQTWRGKIWVSLGRRSVTIANERALRNLARGA